MLEHTWASLVTGGESGTEQGVVCAGLLARLLSLSFYLCSFIPTLFSIWRLGVVAGMDEIHAECCPTVVAGGVSTKVVEHLAHQQCRCVFLAVAILRGNL